MHAQHYCICQIQVCPVTQHMHIIGGHKLHMLKVYLLPDDHFPGAEDITQMRQ